jgi:hypothetical protein
MVPVRFGVRRSDSRRRCRCSGGLSFGRRCRRDPPSGRCDRILPAAPSVHPHGRRGKGDRLRRATRMHPRLLGRGLSGRGDRDVALGEGGGLSRPEAARGRQDTDAGAWRQCRTTRLNREEAAVHKRCLPFNSFKPTQTPSARCEPVRYLSADRRRPDAPHLHLPPHWLFLHTVGHCD